MRLPWTRRKADIVKHEPPVRMRRIAEPAVIDLAPQPVPGRPSFVLGGVVLAGLALIGGAAVWLIPKQAKQPSVQQPALGAGEPRVNAPALPVIPIEKPAPAKPAPLPSYVIDHERRSPVVLHRGPNGGCYTESRNGTKHYVSRNRCR